MRCRLFHFRPVAAAATNETRNAIRKYSFGVRCVDAIDGDTTNERKKQYARIPTDFITDKFNKVYFSSLGAGASERVYAVRGTTVNISKTAFFLALPVAPVRARNFHTLFS